ncbi:single-pass membrane protein with aspartate-rich tail 1b [Syngnathoides biaculeatus]|uniref:single-pass membrane protein with aspartate-rich tail 1b n=1 Tax=Syngnathoides biaculeatus TaxID=300417 RepID=UPI002ADD34D1|nr:single-pass membrane protein with aspartate-rich tail 1b [Syngnathoides biaculeatus]XP_061685136.1 single-pass membrane protein with aspartate-rich tail 1b [Syngnathoides biaculeatus]
MAMNLLRFSLPANIRNAGLLGRKKQHLNRTIITRNVVSTSSGAILPKPEKTPFGLVRMTAVVVPFLYVGTLISKNFAALLEEHDIFVPEDDDDDD